MARHRIYISLAAVLLAAGAAAAADPPPKKAEPPAPPPAPAEDARKGDDYRQFFKKPETTEDYWLALRYEIEVGRYDLAAGLLHALLAKPPTEDELLRLEDQYGMAAFLSLRNVEWSGDPKVMEQARQDTGQLIDLVREAVKKKLGDPKRIQLFVKNLNGDPEEHDFALKELYRSGGQVVPSIFDALRTSPPEERTALLDALRRLGPDTLPPLYAALDSEDRALTLDVLDILSRRGAKGAVPYLWHLTGEGQPDDVRRAATRVLATFLGLDSTDLPQAKVALTREAERYYGRRVPFADPNAVVVWRWDPESKNVVRGWPGAEAVTKDQAEEYYGMRFAKEALALDPAYTPAQVVLLSLALEKGAAKAGPAPGQETPAVRELLESVNPDLITTVLERALDEGRTPVILPAVRALGEMDDVRSDRPGAHGPSALVRALNYPDRRVQMAAADALVRIPATPAPQTAGRIVEVWRRALAAGPAGKAAPKVIVGYFNEGVGSKIADAVQQAGFDTVQLRTGRDVLKRLNQAADIDLVLIDEALPDPGLASLLAQLRADPNYGRLPVVLTYGKERENAVRDLAERLQNVSVLPEALTLSVADLKPFLQKRLGEAGPPLSEAELKDYAEKAIRHLAEAAAGQPPGFDVRPTAETVFAALRSGALGPEAEIDAIHVAGAIPAARAQTELTDVVLAEKQPPKVRAAATAELIRHIQAHGLNLNGEQVGALTALYAKGGDPDLKNELALLMGGMRPDARLTGERLLNFQPPPPGPPPKEPPVPLPKPKEPPAKD
jgi:CheY-like chemotaxis protein